MTTAGSLQQALADLSDARMKGPFIRVEDGGPVKGVFSCEPGK